MNEYCRTRAAPDGSSLYYACLYQSADTRPKLYALFALYYELLDAVLSASDPGVSRIKLEWWREELARLQAGQPRHPVAEALQALIQSGDLDAAPLTDLPAIVETLFSLSPGGNGNGWQRAEAMGAFWRSAAGLAGPVAGHQTALIDSTGAGLARLEILQNLRQLLTLGFNPLPADELAEAGLQGQALTTDPAAESVRRLAASLVRGLRAELDAVYRQSGPRPGAHLLFILIMNRIAAATCDEIHRDGGRLLSQRVALTPIRKLWIAWRTKYARMLKSYKL